MHWIPVKGMVSAMSRQRNAPFRRFFKPRQAAANGSQDGGAQAECLGQLVNELVRKAFLTAHQENGAAKAVETLDILLPVQGELPTLRADDTTLRTVSEAVDALVDNAETAKGALRGLRDLAGGS